MNDLNIKIDSQCFAQFIELSKTKFSGTIKFSNQDGGLIMLTSKSFNKILLPPVQSFKLAKELDLIVGILSNGTKFTIVKPTPTHFRTGDDMITIGFSFRYLIIGINFSSIDKILSKEVALKIPSLKHYVNESKIDIEHKNGSKRIEIKGQLGPSFSVNIDDDLSIGFDWEQQLKSNMEGISLKQDLLIKIRSKKLKPLADFVSIGEKIEVFSGFLFYSKIAFHSFSFNSLGRRCQLHIKQDHHNQNTGNIESKIYTIPYQQNIFSSLLRNYLLSFDKFRTIYLLAYENVSIANKFSTNQFLNAMQAIEAFHTLLHDKVKIDKAEYKVLIQQIKGGISNNHFELLKPSLDFGNNYRLIERLNDLVDIYGGGFLESIGFDKDFAKVIRNTRNVHTHPSGSNKEILKGGELFYATVKINVVLIFFIFHELGAEKTILNQNFRYFWNMRFFFIK